MTQPGTETDLQQQIFARAQESGPAAAAALCREVLDSGTVPDGVTRAMLLVQIGEYSEMAGDSEAAGQAFRAAVEDDSPARPDARCYLANWFADHGDRTQADRIIAEVWAGRPRDPDVYLYLGEHFEVRDDLASAIRWYTAGLLRAMRDPSLAPSTVPILLVARRRARLANGFGEDDFDRRAREAMGTPGTN